MNGTNICQQQIWGSRNYQIKSYFGDMESAITPTLVPTVMVRFNSSDIHHPVATRIF